MTEESRKDSYEKGTFIMLHTPEIGINITDAEFRVLCAMLCLCKSSVLNLNGTDKVTISYQEIADHTNKTRQQICNIMESLIKKGYMKKIGEVKNKSMRTYTVDYEFYNKKVTENINSKTKKGKSKREMYEKRGCLKRIRNPSNCQINLTDTAKNQSKTKESVK